MVEMLQLYGTPEKSPDSVVEVRIGANRGIDWGNGIPVRRGTHVRLYPVVRWAPVLGWLQENVREVSDTDITSKVSTGYATVEQTLDLYCSSFL